MERVPLRKPKLYFDAGANPSHVTFDDGKDQRRNLPWMHYVEARWGYAEPDTIKIEIGEWLVIVRGHNLAPLFLAIEEHTLVRLRAQPELQADREHEADTFAVEIWFTKPPANPFGKRPPVQLELDTG
jgi:hypothetical protein